jgi:putative transposase
MRNERFKAEQIVGIPHEAAAGTEIRELCRRHGITETTFYRWRRKYGGLQVTEAKRLKALEEENRQLKRLVAEQALDLAMLKDVAGRRW